MRSRRKAPVIVGTILLLAVVLLAGACDSAELKFGRAADSGPAPNLGNIDELVLQSLQRWRVPGLAIGIVMDGEVVYAREFGFRDPELELPVTTRTNFGLASMTKAFTALVASLLVDDSVLDWDTPVHERVPEFVLIEDDLTTRITLRDLLSHRTGLADKNELWTSGDFLAEEIFERLDELEVAGSLRDHFEYNNVLYIAAAELVGRLTGTSWDVVAARRLLEPLGMNRTGFSIEQLLRSDEFSVSFSEEDGAYTANEFPGPEHNAWFFTRGSGSMYSSVDDMTLWLLYQLGQGDGDAPPFHLLRFLRRHGLRK